jgi:hypothetical protein
VEEPVAEEPVAGTFIRNGNLARAQVEFLNTCPVYASSGVYRRYWIKYVLQPCALNLWVNRWHGENDEKIYTKYPHELSFGLFDGRLFFWLWDRPV